MPVDAVVRWHPLLALDEPQPGRWQLRDQYESVYADIALVRRDGTVGYRVLVLVPGATQPVEVGLVSSLKAAVEVGHRQWVAGHANPERVDGHRR